MKSRRDFLLTGITSTSVLIAGCNEGVTEDGNGSGDSAEWQTLESDTRNIPEDDAYVEGMDLNETTEVRVTFTVREGPPIDFVTSTRPELDEYREGNRFQYFDRMTDLDTTGGGVSGRLEEGNYGFLFDNTNLLEAEPPTNLNDDIARVEYEIEYRA